MDNYATYGSSIYLYNSIFNISNVDVEIKNRITEYGMNNALMEIYLEVRVRPVIVMPFLSEEIDIVNTIPLVTEIIQGDVPYTYWESNS